MIFRADAAFAKSEVCEALQERSLKYAIRLPSNDSREREITGLLTRPVGRPGYKPVVWHKSFLYQAAIGRQRGGGWPRQSYPSGSCFHEWDSR